jgi:hypothetical protein
MVSMVYKKFDSFIIGFFYRSFIYYHVYGYVQWDGSNIVWLFVDLVCTYKAYLELIISTFWNGIPSVFST